MKSTQEITTMEQVQGALTDGAVLQYGPLVFVTGISETGGFQAKIFEFTEFSEETGADVEQCRISFQEESPQNFSDGGRAIEWCLDRAKEYYLTN